MFVNGLGGSRLRRDYPCGQLSSGKAGNPPFFPVGPWFRKVGSGHEERFPPIRLSTGCGFRKETIAGMRRNGRDAPKNEPARAGGEHASCSAYFYEVDAR